MGVGWGGGGAVAHGHEQSDLVIARGFAFALADGFWATGFACGGDVRDGFCGKNDGRAWGGEEIYGADRFDGGGSGFWGAISLVADDIV